MRKSFPKINRYLKFYLKKITFETIMYGRKVLSGSNFYFIVGYHH